ncbi:MULTISPECIES: NAD-dependent formate dehydrogenase [Clostridia]|uniref:NAD-dependent formate dehydrogenase n=1 Tax=Clostridia TaxID=186801 RepID=UPI000EA264D7|nr:MULTISPECIES: NAD-dependent formate dehydrogenase [Clostridia]NBJ68126.1 NAD-dependent formate dehydrogenase [Roseburia sp. 1XD42-34]RKI81901.1 NAD-dependent formate dehydrogenase [Clostridium sp. 1xD42-85]
MKILALFPETTSDTQLLSQEESLGLKEFLKNTDHELTMITSDKDVDRFIEDVDVVISSPFLPAYITKERAEKAKNLKLAITAGIGSDHVDLDAAIDKGITVAEIPGSNNVSVAEQNVMEALLLLRNYEEGHRQAEAGEWDLPKVGATAHDIIGKTIGIFGFGRIGQLTAERLQPFEVHLQYHDPYRKKELEEKMGIRYVDFDTLVQTSDVIIIQSPLTKDTKNKFDKNVINKMKDGIVLVNCARGGIVEKEAIAEAVKSGKIRYGGDVWYPQPAPKDHPWRSLKQTGLTVHYSGMTVEAQERIQQGVHNILTSFMKNKPIEESYLIVQDHKVANSSYQTQN